MKKVLPTDPRRSAPPWLSNLFAYNEVSEVTGSNDLNGRAREITKRPETMSTRNAQVNPLERDFLWKSCLGGALELGDERSECPDDLRRLDLALLEGHLQTKRLPSNAVLEDEALRSPSLGLARKLPGLFAVDLSPGYLLHQGGHFFWGILSNYL